MSIKFTVNDGALQGVQDDLAAGMSRMLHGIRADAQQRAPVRKHRYNAKYRGGKRNHKTAQVEIVALPVQGYQHRAYTVGGKVVSGQTRAEQEMRRLKSRISPNAPDDVRAALKPKSVTKTIGSGRNSFRVTEVHGFEGRLVGDQSKYSSMARRQAAVGEGVRNIGNAGSPKFEYGGTLRRSITVDDVTREGNRIIGRVYTDDSAPYARAVEYGLHPGGGMKAQHFMEPAWENAVPDGQSGANKLAQLSRGKG